ncbi:MAG: tRNA-specific adenosine deaminase [Elusimicrobia bacterium RIFOXYB2_FULL_50_12]|nr:MAG: tRNA-specific adenosine deaminase [Elusimicrobia bacterium RIFOXYB2_FULL_50_12]
MSITYDAFMREAIKEARKAEKKGEVPVGAVITLNDVVIARGHNRSITRNDPTAHAEIIALRAAARKLNNYRLPGCKLFVTVEPCPMCAGAIVWARISKVIFGAPDPKAGKPNHRALATGPVLQQECSALLKDFFRKKRCLFSSLRSLRARAKQS